MFCERSDQWIWSREAYIVLICAVEREWGFMNEVLFSRVDDVSFTTCVRRVVPILLSGIEADEGRDRYGTKWESVPKVLRSILRGAFSSGDGCDCDQEVFCDQCLYATGRWMMFVVQNCYVGVEPCGKNHWFKGVTDAVGALPGKEEYSWLE